MMIAAAKTKSPAKQPEDDLHEKAHDFLFGRSTSVAVHGGFGSRDGDVWLVK